MKANRSKIILFVLVALIICLPITASAATFLNLKLTIGDKVETLQIPLYKILDKNQNSRIVTTYKYVYQLKDGKWTLISQGDKGIIDKPTPGIGTKTPAAPKPSVPPTPQEPVVEPPKEEAKDPVDSKLSVDEQKMLEMVNNERKKAGLQPLSIDMRLVDISRKKSQDMIDNNYFSHTSPTYGSPFDVLKANGIAYRYAGENIAGAPTVERAHNALMQSPGHRANILNPNYNYIGIGIVDGGRYGKMYTQTFIGTK
ncbi:MAG: CAP domain-containing protein [Tepidanaerobacteraceae bacterium]|jgi:uncharacterized YkwD family protein